MRVLLVSNASFIPPRGGSTRSNRVWLEELTAAGHECVVVCPAPDPRVGEGAAWQQYEAESEQLRITQQRDGLQKVKGKCGNVWIVGERRHMPAQVANAIVETCPDVVLVSSEDVRQVLLRSVQSVYKRPVVYLAHTPQMLPFGVQSLWPSDVGSRAVGSTQAIVTIGQFMADYVCRYLGRKPTILHPPLYGEKRPIRDSRRDALITIINPCAVKGLSVFLELARSAPYRFAALPGWGTTNEDLRAIAALPNVELLKPCSDIDQVYCRTHVLLVPSLWPEGFGLVATEAMMRGIPVVASNIGGLVEAKLGTRYCLPLRPITQYLGRFDDRGLPMAVLPPQDLSSWLGTLAVLMNDPEEYKNASLESHRAAAAFLDSLRPRAFERFLAALVRN